MFGVLFERNKYLQSYLGETQRLESYNSHFLALRRASGFVGYYNVSPLITRIY